MAASRGLLGRGNAGQPVLISDNLAGRYTNAADDGSTSESRREAAMLFSVAEGHLNDEAANEALSSARNALAIFRAVGDSIGTADSQRLVMHATRMKAVAARTAGNCAEAEKLLTEAEAAMRNAATAATEGGDRRGQAAMLLTLAEALHDLGGSPKRAEALDCLLDAQDLADAVGDTKLQALILLEKAAVLHSKHNFKGASSAGKEAAALFRTVKDLRNEGLAWYSAGAAEINCGRLEEGLRGKAKAAKLWKDAGEKRLQAGASASCAEWYLLEKDDCAGSLTAAKESLELYAQLKDKNGEAVARCWIIESYIRNKEPEKALEEAKVGVEAAKAQDDPKATFWALECLTRAQIASSDLDAALESAQAAAGTAVNLRDKRFKPRGLELVSSVYVAMDRLDLAKEKAMNIEEAVKDLKGFEEEAFKSLQFLTQVLMMQRGGGGDAARCGGHGDPHSAMEQARAIAERAHDAYLEAQALLTISGLDAMVGDLGKAVKAATLAKEMFHEEGYTRGEGRAMKSLAEFHMLQGDAASAVQIADEGVTLLKEFGDNRVAAILQYTLANIHLTSGQPVDAARAAMDALKLARMEEDKRTTVQVLFMCLDCNNVILSDVASDETQSKAFKQGCERMMRFAKEAAGIAVKIKDSGMEAAASYWVGHLHLMQGQVREGQAASSKTISLAKEIKDTSLQVRTMVLTAHSHLALGEQVQAVRVLSDAVRLAQEAGESEGHIMAHVLLETIVGAQQAAIPAWDAMQQQWSPGEIGQSTNAHLAEYKAPEPLAVKAAIVRMVQGMCDCSDDVDGDTPIIESGIDSLASVELRTQLQEEFRLNLPSTVMTNYPTISRMTSLIVDDCASKKISWS